jgi:hypothetical protein
LAVFTSPAAGAVDWDNVDFYWGDERFLPKGHPDRNETQAREKLLTPLSIAEARIHAMLASDGKWGHDAVAAAAGHALELAELAGKDSSPAGKGTGTGASAATAAGARGTRQTLALIDRDAASQLPPS